ncbi:uncharacterized protein SCHCODRAFT_02633649 [Schizophyllum commune H4-8]|uniref:uncharacterized protein n=1 Tax=Schizophyllum commune (strain H4-8 / FGSC 9210) TaxID=578458 RepID=UPI00215F2A0A|nr:uncharacterized protein SCHCODRAFT_02633649 [Schizophyllum commune H4-8]KAI5889141.1 hypothetical protein SCHCODRAFT_02633649 [Schizophyllum commune H4-8]
MRISLARREPDSHDLQRKWLGTRREASFNSDAVQLPRRADCGASCAPKTFLRLFPWLPLPLLTVILRFEVKQSDDMAGVSMAAPR